MTDNPRDKLFQNRVESAKRFGLANNEIWYEYGWNDATENASDELKRLRTAYERLLEAVQDACHMHDLGVGHVLYDALTQTSELMEK